MNNEKSMFCVEIEPVIIIILYFIFVATNRLQNILMMRKNQKQEQVGEKKGTNIMFECSSDKMPLIK